MEKLKEKAVSEVMEVLTQEGMTFSLAKRVIKRVIVLMGECSENYTENASASEVLKTPTWNKCN